MKDSWCAVGWKGIGVIPVLVWPEVGSPTELLHQLHSRFLLTDYGYLLQRCRQMMDSRPARFLFPVALLPVPAWWQTPSFQSEYPRGQYHGPILPRLRAEGHTREFGLGDHFRSGYFRFRWVQGGGVGRRHDNLIASGCNKTRFFHGKARILAVNILLGTSYEMSRITVCQIIHNQ